VAASRNRAPVFAPSLRTSMPGLPLEGPLGKVPASGPTSMRGATSSGTPSSGEAATSEEGARPLLSREGDSEWHRPPEVNSAVAGRGAGRPRWPLITLSAIRTQAYTHTGRPSSWTDSDSNFLGGRPVSQQGPSVLGRRDYRRQLFRLGQHRPRDLRPVGSHLWVRPARVIPRLLPS
jgi:hypothetical protein